MRLLPVLTCLAVVIGPAAPAHADSDNDDAVFLAAVAKAGIGFKNPDRAVAAGKKVCDLAEAGRSQIEILSAVRSHNPGFSLDGAAAFTELAAKAYCPDRMATGSDQGGDDTG